MDALLYPVRKEEAFVIQKYRNDKHFMSWWSFLHTGEVVGRQFCYHDIPERSIRLTMKHLSSQIQRFMRPAQM